MKLSGRWARRVIPSWDRQSGRRERRELRVDVDSIQTFDYSYDGADFVMLKKKNPLAEGCG
jgi:hypothetical protein